MIAVIGDIGFDVLSFHGKLIKSMGGSAFHTLMGCLCVQKEAPYLLASVGYDFMIEYLQSLGVSTKYINVVRTERTARFIISYGSGKREMVIKWGATGYSCVDLIDKKVLNSNIIHLTASLPSKQLEYIQVLKRMGFCGRISVDVWDQHCIDYPEATFAVLENANIVFMNSDERRILKYEPENPEKLYVFKLAEKGAVCYFGGTSTSSIDCNIDTDRIVDPTGAGDVLAGALLTQLDTGIPIKIALDRSVTLATKSILAFGTDHLLKAKLFDIVNFLNYEGDL